MRDIKRFYQEIQKDIDLRDKAKIIQSRYSNDMFTREEQLKFVEIKLIPLANRHGCYFSVKEFLEFDECLLDNEDLAEIFGGISSKKFIGGALIGVSLFTSTAYLVGQQNHKIGNIPTITTGIPATSNTPSMDSIFPENSITIDSSPISGGTSIDLPPLVIDTSKDPESNKKSYKFDDQKNSVKDNARLEDFEITTSEDGTAILTKYNGTASSVVIPNHVTKIEKRLSLLIKTYVL